ncbi:MAG: hypothetical protein S4CHLAM37_03810 [Chlamydiia bacterium]|nr:hypothetical protein [Chlamydiia bacterium]
MKKLFLFFVLTFSSFVYSSGDFYYFVPPKNWKVVDPSKIPDFVKISFVSNSPKTFKPSLNLVTESANASIEEFVASAKKHHIASRKNKWSEIGYVQTKSGKAHVSQIDTKAECGDIRTMQCILKDGNLFYIITAVALRDEFIDYHNEFLQAFETFQICQSATDTLPSKELKERYHTQVEKLEKGWKSFLLSQKSSTPSEESFNHKKFRKKHWVSFEKALAKTFKDQGLFWQVMAASEAKKALLATSE